MWLGEFEPAATVNFKFTTRNSSGVPTALSGGTISVYKGSNTTESTAGVTLTASFDSVVGLNQITIDTSADGTFYATANDFQVVITAGTVSGTSVVGEVVGSFSLRNRAPLKPASVGRTLVVDTAGLADANVVKLGPTGSGTAQTARDIGLALPAAAPNANGGLPILSSSGTTLGYTVTTLTTYTGNTPQTGDSFARIGAAGAGLTALGDTRIANLDAAVSTRMATYTQPTGFLAASFPSDPADQSLIIAATNAIVSLIGSPSATLAGDIAAVKVDTAAVKLKTDQLTFTVALSVDATASVSAASIRSAIGMATNDLDTQLDAILAASGGGATGSGSSTYVVTVDDGTNPLDGAEVWVSTDLAGTSISAGTLHTDAFGVATFLLDPGDYFLWVQHSRYNGTNPTAFTVT